jgi:phospholipid/cholesterol/gamma-HCH transport system permease protein
METIQMLLRPITLPLGRVITKSVKGLGEWCLFSWTAIKWMTLKPFRWDVLMHHMEFIGVRSTPIIMLTGFFVGAVFALQTGKAYALFNAETLVGATIGLSLTREIAPVFAALMVTARACSSMAAEIGTMRVTEQVDALKVMAVSPMQFLVTPRVVATTLMTPLLTALFNFVGIIGSYFVGIYLLNIQEGPFLHKLYYYVDAGDLLGGLVKSAFFGFFISLISCYQGYVTSNGAQGVGRATTRAVVISSVTVLIMDYFLTTWILTYFTDMQM